MKKIAAIIGAGAAIALAVPSSASAASGPPSGAVCSVGKGATVCFQPRGDVMWVKDNKKDGRAVISRWFIDDTDQKHCTNRNGSAAGWTYCNYNMPEGKTVWFRAHTINKNGQPVPDGTSGPLVSDSTS